MRCAPLLSALLLTLFIAALPRPVLAGGFSMATFGARRGGMIATIGAPDDVSAVFHNPAGLADQPGAQIYFFLSPGVVDPEFRLKAHDPEFYPEINPSGCGEAGGSPCPWPVDSEGYYEEIITTERSFGLQPFLAGATDLGFIHPAAEKVVVALALFAPNAYAAFLPEDAPTAYHVIGGLFVVGTATLGVGYRPHPKIALGASISYNYMTISLSQKMSAVDALTPPGKPPEPVAIGAQGLVGDIRMDYTGVDHGVGWSAALLINPEPWIGLGITYSGATNPHFVGDLELRGTKDQYQDPDKFREVVGAFQIKLPEQLEIQMPIPHSLGVGLNLKLAWWIEVGLEGRFWFYQEYNKQVLRPIYDADKSGKEPMTEESLSKPKNYNLSYQLTGGFLFRPLYGNQGLELMCGTGYDDSPIPDSTFSLENPSLSHWKVAVGARWAINKSWRVALTYYLNIFVPRDIDNSKTNPPTNVQGRGFSHSPGLEIAYKF